MKLNAIALHFVFLFFTTVLKGQGYLLIVPSADCEISIDGEGNDHLTKGKPQKYTLTIGEHYVHSKSIMGVEKDDIITIENGKQKVLKIEFDNASFINTSNQIGESPFILVADLNLTLAGEVNSLTQEGLKEYTSYSELYYAFDKGDQVLIDGDILNKKGKFFIQLLKYPEGNPIYTKQRLEELKNHNIHIQERSIYVIRIGTNALFNKQIKLSIKRKPLNTETINFNTNVLKKTRYNTVNILEPSQFYINSTTNKTWKGGTSEIIVPVTAPNDVIEWFYIVSASREEQEIKSNLESISLLGDLSKIISGVNPATAAFSIGLDLITQPPGSDYCNVYLLDYDNQSLFTNGKLFSYVIEGSRENVKSAQVKINCCKGKQFYLGIQNKDQFNGIHVGIEVVGVTKEEYLEHAY